eukprot:1469146-Pleurochrysis_carterae.AAC.3
MDAEGVAGLLSCAPAPVQRRFQQGAQPIWDRLSDSAKTHLATRFRNGSSGDETSGQTCAKSTQSRRREAHRSMQAGLHEIISTCGKGTLKGVRDVDR